MNDNLVLEIRALVARIMKLPEDKVSLEANLFDDLGIDSLVGVEIFAALDKKYGVVIPENKLSQVTTLKDLANLVAELQAKKVSK